MWEKRWEEEEMKRKEEVERRRLTETKRRESAGFSLQFISYSVIERVPATGETCILKHLASCSNDILFPTQNMEGQRYSVFSYYSA